MHFYGSRQYIQKNVYKYNLLRAVFYDCHSNSETGGCFSIIDGNQIILTITDCEFYRCTSTYQLNCNSYSVSGGCFVFQGGSSYISRILTENTTGMGAGACFSTISSIMSEFNQSSLSIIRSLDLSCGAFLCDINSKSQYINITDCIIEKNYQAAIGFGCYESQSVCASYCHFSMSKAYTVFSTSGLSSITTYLYNIECINNSVTLSAFRGHNSITHIFNSVFISHPIPIISIHGSAIIAFFNCYIDNPIDCTIYSPYQSPPIIFLQSIFTPQYEPLCHTILNRYSGNILYMILSIIIMV